ncbi:hypothetical protein [Pseudomonas zeae]|uniref:hypothetical protein n=1 Tax=Pseudomonas zeae TaxID=2745510 RepID=UPI0039DF4B51
MQTAFKMIILGTLTLWLGACGVGYGVKDPDSHLEAGNGLGPGDIRVKALPLVKVQSTRFDSVTVFVYDADNADNHFAFTLERVNVKPGYSVDESYNNDKKLVVSAQWNGRRYAESTRLATHAHFTIEAITDHLALIQLSARLVDPLSGSFINLPQRTVNLTGPDLDALVEKSVM